MTHKRGTLVSCSTNDVHSKSFNQDAHSSITAHTQTHDL